MKPTRFALLTLLLAALCGCGALASKEETCVVIARRAQVRSSTAIVAADLKEVVRGDALDVLDTVNIQETGGERWLRVRTRDAEPVEGWIEGRNVISQEMVERSKRLAQEDEGVPAQASGQLRASTNIRFSPERDNNDNILMKLESGARFDIVGWKRVPRPKSLETAEVDDAPKAGSTGQGSSRRRRDREEQKEPEEPNELWYKVRLPSSISPAPAGWVYGKQVELTVPSDIIFYRTGREFVAWQRLDGEAAEAHTSETKDNDAAQEARPGSWVILEKSGNSEANGPDAPDFDRIFVLGYDKDRQEHYTAYRSPDLKGYLPLKVEGKGDNKTFTVRIQGDGQHTELRFRAYNNERGLLKVEALSDIPKSVKAR
ncbi:MAG TPA: hypothetical protein VGX48_19220 [Pyrinomonadaceae bacterium]|nr:hypothetical protein [Pyrinomonadaceae bacterium]